MNSALDYLYSFINYETNSSFQYNDLYYNLERTRYLLKILGNPEKDLKMIHVAGTKGKGSVCMIINRLLKVQGFSTGLFLSPHIERINERIVVNDQEISNGDFISLLNRLKSIIDKLRQNNIPTTFEILTVMAILYFKEKEVEYGIFETGMGGRFDSTNIGDPVISIITPISYDHMDKLGNSIEDIAYEKAGIIKKDRPVVVGIQKYPIYPILEKKATGQNAALYRVDKLCLYKVKKIEETGIKFDVNIDSIKMKNIFTSLLGIHQIENILLSLLSLKIINRIPEEKFIKKSLKSLNFKTRLEIINQKNRLFILDSAHNEESAMRLVEAIKGHFKNRRVISIIGIVKGKDIEGIIKNISSLSHKIIVVNPVTHKELDTEKVYRIAKSYKENSLLIKDIYDAIENAFSISTNSDIILITGSFYTTSPARKLIYST